LRSAAATAAVLVVEKDEFADYQVLGRHARRFVVADG
jgi:hypothetical protein